MLRRTEGVIRTVLVLGIDIGGSSVKASVVSTGNVPAVVTPLAVVPVRPTTIAQLEHVLLEQVREQMAAAPGPLAAVGISTTGWVDHTGAVRRCDLYSGYAGVRWAERLRRVAPGLPVVVVNDGWASAWAEYRRSDADTHVHAVIGTGVGGGLVLAGRLVRGVASTAGRIGHIKVPRAIGRRCVCGQEDCCEVFASASAVVSSFLAASPDDVVGPVTVRDVAAQARAGDAAATAAFIEAGHWLGTALGTVMNLVNPDVISVGGGVIAASQAAGGRPGGPYLAGVRAGLRESVSAHVLSACTVVVGTHDAEAGVIGAALLAVSGR